MIQSGEVAVNGQEESRRGRTLLAGDVVAVAGEQYRVTLGP
jgi:ribosome-associated protein YbcJ (S4-like RNA binding protein)